MIRNKHFETLTLSAAVRLREQLDAEYAEEDRMWLGDSARFGLWRLDQEKPRA